MVLKNLILVFACITLFSACATITAPVALEPISVTSLTKSHQSWDGSLLPNYLDGQPEVTILRIIIQPGARLQWHKHPVINAGVIIRGQIVVETQEQEMLQLKAGDTIVELVNKWHHGLNNGTEAAELIVFYAGIVDTPLSILKQTDDSASHD